MSHRQNDNLKINARGLELIKVSEGPGPRLYNDPAGHCTIGYGHLVHRRPCDGRPNEVEFLQGVTEERATELLCADSGKAADTILAAVNVPLNDDQFSALVVFVYNIGDGAFRRSTLLRLLNDGQYSAVPEQLRRWKYAGGKVLKGLVTRRKRESALWNSAPEDEDD